MPPESLEVPTAIKLFLVDPVQLSDQIVFIFF
jgi:hypothetical protein